MIEELYRIIVSKDKDMQTSRLPNNEEMMNKINEIVSHINDHSKKEKEKLSRINPFTTKHGGR